MLVFASWTDNQEGLGSVTLYALVVSFFFWLFFNIFCVCVWGGGCSTKEKN